MRRWLSRYFSKGKDVLIYVVYIMFYIFYIYTSTYIYIHMPPIRFIPIPDGPAGAGDVADRLSAAPGARGGLGAPCGALDLHRTARGAQGAALLRELAEPRGASGGAAGGACAACERAARHAWELRWEVGGAHGAAVTQGWCSCFAVWCPELLRFKGKWWNERRNGL